MSRYHAIVDPPDGREIDYDSVDPNVTKPTKAAIRVNDLLEGVTGMQTIKVCKHKLNAMQVDIAIFHLSRKSSASS